MALADPFIEVDSRKLNCTKLSSGLAGRVPAIRTAETSYKSLSGFVFSRDVGCRTWHRGIQDIDRRVSETRWNEALALQKAQRIIVPGHSADVLWPAFRSDPLVCSLHLSSKAIAIQIGDATPIARSVCMSSSDLSQRRSECVEPFEARVRGQGSGSSPDSSFLFPLRRLARVSAGLCLLLR